MKTCTRCGKETDMPFHTCNPKTIPLSELAAKITPLPFKVVANRDMGFQCEMALRHAPCGVSQKQSEFMSNTPLTDQWEAEQEANFDVPWEDHCRSLEQRLALANEQLKEANEDSTKDDTDIREICRKIIPDFVDGDSNAVPTVVDCVEAALARVTKLWEDAVTYQETELKPKYEQQLLQSQIQVERLREALQHVVDSCVHPEVAVRAVMVDLKPIREVLQSTQTTGKELGEWVDGLKSLLNGQSTSEIKLAVDKATNLLRSVGKADAPATDLSSTWLIEYEIPPLRAIYHAETTAATEQEALDNVKTYEPLWRVRKITKKGPDSTATG